MIRGVRGLATVLSRPKVRYPKCDAVITVPRIQINDAVDERAQRKPYKSTRYETGSPSVLVCVACSLWIARERKSKLKRTESPSTIWSKLKA